MIIRSVLLLGLLLQAACIGDSGGDGCGPMQRFLTASGDIRDGRNVIATGAVTLMEQQGDPSLLTVRVTDRTGSELAGHVRGARLAHARTRAAVGAFRITPAAAGGNEIAGSTPGRIEDVDAVKRILRGRDGVLLLETSLPGRERITVPLTDVRARGWKRAACG